MDTIKIAYAWHIDETYCIKMSCSEPFIYTHVMLSCINNDFAVSAINDIAYVFRRMGAKVRLSGMSKLAPHTRNAKTCKRVH